MAQRAQDEAGALLLDNLKEELEERSMEQQVDRQRNYTHTETMYQLSCQ